MTKSFHATLNLSFEARDEQQALEIAQVCKDAIQAWHDHPQLRLVQPHKVEVDIDDVEEN